MLVIHNGTQMWPTTNSPKRYSPGDNVTKPDGNFYCPAAAGADMGGGWIMAELLDADPVPDGFEEVGVSPDMVNGVPKMVRQLQAVTPEIALARRETAVKAECRERIFSVCSQTDQVTLAMMAESGIMDAADRTAYRQVALWVEDMVHTCRTLIPTEQDYTDDTLWPPVPAGVPELIQKY